MCASERRAPALESGPSRTGGELPSTVPGASRPHERMCGVARAGDGAASVRGVCGAGGVTGTARGSAGGGVRDRAVGVLDRLSKVQALTPSTRGVACTLKLEGVAVARTEAGKDRADWRSVVRSAAWGSGIVSRGGGEMRAKSLRSPRQRMTRTAEHGSTHMVTICASDPRKSSADSKRTEFPYG